MTEFKVDPDVLTEILHSGVKGMKWGVRKEDVTAHNKITDQLVSSIKSAKTEDDVEWVLVGALANGQVEGNIKIENVSPSVDGTKMNYELKAYRLTEGAANTHSGDGVKVEHITKEVPRDPSDVPKDGGVRVASSYPKYNAASLAVYMTVPFLSPLPTIAARLTVPVVKVAQAFYDPMSSVYAASKTEIWSNTIRLHSKYSQPGHKLSEDRSLQKAYNKEFKTIVNKALNSPDHRWYQLISKATRRIALQNLDFKPTDKFGLRFDIPDEPGAKATLTMRAPKGQSKNITVGTIRHDDGLVDYLTIQIDVVRDAEGFITDMVFPDAEPFDEVAQHMEDYGLTWQTFLEHSGVKGMKWGVRKDERPLGTADQALNVSQRAQVKVASSISALAAIGMSTNAAATLFQLQNRWEHLQGVNAIINEAENNPLVSDAGKEALRATKNNIIKGIVGSAVATTAVSVAIGVVTKRTATAYFAPMHKVYGDVKPKINSDLRKLSKDIKAGKRPKLTVKDYNKEVASIVQKHMTQDKSNLLKPFHELARSQLGLQYNTRPLDIRFEKLPNTDLMNKMTVISPDGLVLVKAIKVVQHDALDGWADGIDLYFDYKFDAEGYISEFSCPTIEVAKDLVEGTLDVNSIPYRYNTVENPTDPLEEVVYHMDEDYETTWQDYLAHHGIKGMKWGRRRPDGPDGTVSGGTKDKSDDPGASEKSKGSSTPTKVGHNSNEDNFLSADADRFLKTRNKDQHEMSDREIKEAIGRAKAIDEYNKLFNPTAAQQMQDKLAALQAETQYNALQRQMNPTAIDRVNALVDKASGPYQLFTKIDGALDGAISSEIKKGVIGAFSTGSTSSSTHTPRPPREPKAPKEKKKRGWFGGKKDATTEAPTSPFSPGPRPSKPSPVFDITSMGKDDPVTAGWSSYTSSHPATPRALSAPSPSGRTQSGKSLIRENLVTLQDHLDYMAQQKRFGYDS